MKKKSGKRAGKKKAPAPPLAIQIEVGPKATLKDVERAIEKNLAIHRTELFRNNDTVVIVVEDEGGLKPPRPPR